MILSDAPCDPVPPAEVCRDVGAVLRISFLGLSDGHADFIKEIGGSQLKISLACPEVILTDVKKLRHYLFWTLFPWVLSETENRCLALARQKAEAAGRIHDLEVELIVVRESQKHLRAKPRLQSSPKASRKKRMKKR